MSRCPVCASARVVIVINAERRGFCPACGAQWIQEGSVQREVRRLSEPEKASIRPSAVPR